MAAPTEIVNLLDRFRRHRDSYRSPSYTETQQRREFIDPFFEALGWDVDNEQGYAEAYKDVIHEDSIKIGDSTKAPDYSFHIGGVRKFFVETKKPATNIAQDVSPAYQLRRYAWSAKLPLSILTDFEEFAVYDCRVRPDKNDKASKARTLYLNYEQYDDQWDEIASFFSREAILKGAFDKYAESTKKKRGTAEVDDAFLKEIEQWRGELARNLALRNKKLSQREINFAVQKTIDRIIFLRICEDRGIERYGVLQSLLNGPKVYARMRELFRKADDRYNSGLFHFTEERNRTEPPDEWTLSLAIDDRVLKDIIRKLYYPESPYEFSVLGAEILGQVYEQFLGKVIRLTKGHQAKVEDKPEVKKAGGVYYTPTYIVDYIVEQTVGKLLEGKQPHEVAARTKTTWKPSKRGRPLTVLDPACGSGLFLIGAYQHLLDWYCDWYVEHDPAKHKERIYQTRKHQWRLTTVERKRILLDHLYGVDIDPQAVEVTKLSLLLKVLEGENQESLQRQLRLFRERALPDLADNIKCGNSLIGPDFYQGKQLDLFDEDERLRINVFDWKTEFTDIMNSGGFDAVIGNPPWISLSGKFGVDAYGQHQIRYLIARYHGNTYMPNMYEYFVTQGLSLICQSGRFSFVVPDRLGFNKQFVHLRERILTETRIDALLYKVPFPGITADTLIFTLEKDPDARQRLVRVAEYGKEFIHCPQQAFADDPLHVFEYFEDEQIMRLTSHIDKSPAISRLEELCDSTSGFGGKSKLIHETKISEVQIPTMKGDSIGRYELRKQYWFDFKKENITGRTTNKRKLGASPKILIRKTGDKIIATYDDSGIFPEQSLYFLFDKTTDLDYYFLLGLLNSALMNAYFRAKCLTNKKSIAQVKKVDLDRLPVCDPFQSGESGTKIHDRVVALVRQMLRLHENRQSAKTTHERTALSRQIEATDREIDRLVYELYGLSDEEIRIVEEATAR